MGIVERILRGDLVAARKELDEAVALIMARKLHEMKKRMMAEMDLSREKPDYSNVEDRRNGATGNLKTDRLDKQVSTSGLKEPKDQNTTVVHKPSPPPVRNSRLGNLEEEEELDEGTRIKIVKARIRGGKIQRRKKVSNVVGMTIRGGKMVRMSAAERRKRKLGAKRAKIKRRGKKTQMLRKRKRSMMKRKTLGI